MQNKKLKSIFAVFATLIMFNVAAVAADESQDEYADDMSANAIAEYNPDDSMFQKITDLEQQKVLMQLEKEKAQLDLDLDRLAAEKIKLHMEIDTLSSNADEQKKALEDEQARLQAEADRLAAAKSASENSSGELTETTPAAQTAVTKSDDIKKKETVSDKYKLIDIIGAGNELQATIENLANGQRKKISVGKNVEDYTVKSISLDDGVIFVKGDTTETLSIGKDE